MKRSFFQAAVVSILLYWCTTWTLTKWLEKKLYGNYPRMLRAILNKSWRQRPTRHSLYGHLPPITKSIKVRRTRHAGRWWRSRGDLISDVLVWPPTYGRAKAGRRARTYIEQLCEDRGCSPEDLTEAMKDWEKWREGQGYPCLRHDMMIMIMMMMIYEKETLIIHLILWAIFSTLISIREPKKKRRTLYISDLFAWFVILLVMQHLHTNS